jgi:hypothetical protein
VGSALNGLAQSAPPIATEQAELTVLWRTFGALIAGGHTGRFATMARPPRDQPVTAYVFIRILSGWPGVVTQR